MAFTVQGVFHGSTVEVTWDDGALRGDPDAVEAVGWKAQIERRVGPEPGPVTTSREAHLKSPLSSYLLITGVMQPVLTVTGDVPDWPRVSPGAIA